MSIIKPALHHVTIKTSKLDDMIAWYATVLGASVQFRDRHAAWMTNDDANHRLGFLAVPGLRDDPSKIEHTGMHHSAFEYESFDDLMTSYARLRDDQIVPDFCLDHGLTMSLYYRDPDGNFVEMQSDNFQDWALSGEFMRTSSDFAANPIGTPFDPEQVFSAHAAGAEFAALQRSIRAGEYRPAQDPNIGLPVLDPETAVDAL